MVPGYHYVTSLMVLSVFVLSLVNALGPGLSKGWLALMYVLAALALIGLYAYSRLFALRAQDRAIRAEEGLRYFILTGKRLPVALRLGQIIALRFAPDEELPALVDRALAEKLTQRQIKEAIVNWRADYHRV